MSKIKGQKGLFVFSDPAGAKACLALAKSFKQKTLLIISDRKYSFYSEFNIMVNNSNDRSILEWYDFFDPDFVFTGTSLPAKIELGFLIEAKSRKIKTYSFVDHWTNISKRFKSFEEYIYPDEIWLIDDSAKEIAINEGVKENIISVSGNPYYDYLKTWKPNTSKEKLMNSIGLKKNEKYILYAVQPITSFNLEEKYGFDELSGLKYLLRSLDGLESKNIKIIIKLHPNQNKTIFLDFVKKIKSDRILLLDDFDINSLIYFSEIVVGYFSNSLIEANIMKKNILRVLIDLTDEKLDSLKILNIGNVIYEMKDLDYQLKKII